MKSRLSRPRPVLLTMNAKLGYLELIYINVSIEFSQGYWTIARRILLSLLVSKQSGDWMLLTQAVTVCKHWFDNTGFVGWQWVFKEEAWIERPILVKFERKSISMTPVLIRNTIWCGKKLLRIQNTSQRLYWWRWSCGFSAKHWDRRAKR